MKILLISDRYYPVLTSPQGGNEAALFTFARMLNNAGHEIFISGPKDSQNILFDKFEIHKWSLPSKSFSDQRILYKPVAEEIHNYAKSIKPDLIISLASTQTIYVPLAEKGWKIITYCTEGPIYGLTSIGLGKSYIKFKQAGGLPIAVSKFVMDEFNKVVPGCLDKYQYLHHVNSEMPDIKFLDAKHDYILGVSRLVKQKMAGTVIRSMIKQNRFQNKLYIGRPPTNPPAEVEYYNTFKEDLNKILHYPLLPRAEVLNWMRLSKVLIEGDRLQASNFVPFESSMEGTFVIKLGKEQSGFKEIAQQIDPEMKLFKEVDIYRCREQEVIDRVVHEINNIEITPERQWELLLKTRKFFSHENWIKRFENSIENYLN